MKIIRRLRQHLHTEKRRRKGIICRRCSVDLLIIYCIFYIVDVCVVCGSFTYCRFRLLCCHRQRFSFTLSYHYYYYYYYFQKLCLFLFIQIVSSRDVIYYYIVFFLCYFVIISYYTSTPFVLYTLCKHLFICAATFLLLK